MFKLRYIAFIYLQRLLITSVDCYICNHFPLQQSKLYTTTINVTQLYQLKIPCEGYLQQIRMYVYNTGTATLAFFTKIHDRTELDGYLTFTFNTTGYKVFNRNMYIGRDMIVGIIIEKNKVSVLRDRLFTNRDQGSEVTAVKSMYMVDDSLDTLDYMEFMYKKITSVPSLQLLIVSDDFTTEPMYTEPDTTIRDYWNTSESTFSDSTSVGDSECCDNLSAASTVPSLSQVLCVSIIICVYREKRSHV